MSVFVREAIVFAIEKEQEAVDFYTDLSKKTDRPELKKVLLEFADMERNHKEKLQNLNVENLQIKPPSEDLKIADYMSTKRLDGNLNYEKILAIAMERELLAQKLYEDLSKIAIDPEVQELFKQLSFEEANHKHYFEKIWDSEILTDN